MKLLYIHICITLFLSPPSFISFNWTLAPSDTWISFPRPFQPDWENLKASTESRKPDFRSSLRNKNVTNQCICDTQVPFCHLIVNFFAHFWFCIIYSIVSMGVSSNGMGPEDPFFFEGPQFWGNRLIWLYTQYLAVCFFAGTMISKSQISSSTRIWKTPDKSFCINRDHKSVPWVFPQSGPWAFNI